MYIVGQEEIDALAAVIRSGALFRYGVGGECERFERRYAEHLGTRHVALTASGTFALTAAVSALGIGPGDEVLVPAHTYMATAMAVLAAGAIPVIVDVDESITIDPDAVEDAIGPRTKAVIPVHMWGAACAMDRIMAIAAKHDLLVLEDTCQAIGGAYEGRRLGTIGHAGAFSFNYYKNMTAGEGGAVCTADDRIAERVKCAIDPCHFYWQGRSDQQKPFAGNGARASELMGAMLNVQLDRLPGMIEAMRAEKQQILAGTAQLGNLGLRPAPINSPDHDCAAQVMYSLPSAEAADAVRRGVSERDRGPDRPAQLHRVGPDPDRRGRRPSGDEPLHHAREPGLPAQLFQGHVPALARHPEPHGHGADPSAAHASSRRRHHPQHRRRGAGGARRHVAGRGGSARHPAGRRPEVRHEGHRHRVGLATSA